MDELSAAFTRYYGLQTLTSELGTVGETEVVQTYTMSIIPERERKRERERESLSSFVYKANTYQCHEWIPDYRDI